MPAGLKPLGEVLVEERLISREQLSEALKRQLETGRPIGKILLEMGSIGEDALVEAVANPLRVPYAALVSYPPSPSGALLISEKGPLRHQAGPVRGGRAGLPRATVQPTAQTP